MRLHQHHARRTSLSLRVPLHIVRLVLKTALVTLLVAVLAFFALTRTQVGRDELRDRLEQEFASLFDGSLEIAELKGNLINDLFARDVRLYDSTGRLVLRIDSVIARPGWRALFEQEIYFSSISLLRPHLMLVYGADGAWNARNVFRRRRTGTENDRTWAFTSADLRIEAGTVETLHTDGPPPIVESGWIFDFSESAVRDIDARLTVEWSSTLKQVDVLHFSARAPDLDLAVEHLAGQFLLDPGRLLLNQVSLEAESTELHLDAVLHRDSSEMGISAVDLDLHEGRFDHDQLRRLFPRLPLAGKLAATASIHGPLSELVVSELSLASGRTRIETQGTLLGLPDSIDVELAVRHTTVDTRDLRRVLPTIDWPDLDYLGPVGVRLTGSGRVRTRGTLAVSAAAEYEVHGRPGRVSGSGSFELEPGRAAAYRLALQADSVDLGYLLRDVRLSSSLNGHLNLEGRGVSLDSLDASLEARLARSALGGVGFDALHLQASAERGTITTTARLDQRGGRMEAGGMLHYGGDRPSFQLDVTTRAFDVAAWLGADSVRTSLNSSWSLSGNGTAWKDLRADLLVSVDSSSVSHGHVRRLIAPHATRLHLAPIADAGSRLLVTGDVVELTADTELSPPALAAAGAFWVPAIVEALRRQVNKPYGEGHASSGSGAPAVVAQHAHAVRHVHLQRLLSTTSADTAQLHVTLELKRADVARALLPAVAPFEEGATTEFTLKTGPDRLDLRGSLQAGRLTFREIRLEEMDAKVDLTARIDLPVDSMFTASISVQADTLHAAGLSVPTPSIVLHHTQGEGQVAFSTGRHEETGPFRLAATLIHLPHRTRLTLEDFHAAFGAMVWTNSEAQPVDLYRDAVVIPGFTLESRLDSAEATQFFRVHGRWSDMQDDTLNVDMRAISLRHLSEVLASKRQIDGRLDGRLVLTGRQQPQLTGHISVDALTFDHRLLGRLSATSRYQPGEPDIALTVTLDPVPPEVEQELVALSPHLKAEENRLRLDGTIRLPDYTRTGELNLHLRADRIDAFFFDYLFPQDLAGADGTIRGAGTVTGTFEKPLFNGTFRVSDGQFEVPHFKLRYAIEGEVDVDQEGFKLRDVRVTDPTGGDAFVSGAILFNDYRYFSFDLRGELDELQIINVPTSRELPFYGTIWASGHASLTGPVYNALLRSADVTTSPQSELFIPLTEEEAVSDPGFIVYTDSSGRVPDLQTLLRRKNLLARRPEGERTFIDGLGMDLNINAPSGSTVHLVIDPLLGDVINAVGNGRIQLQRMEGDFYTYGTFEVTSGDYLFTAGEVFVRRFLIEEGTITWDGDPVDARLDIDASYRTRASTSGLPFEASDRPAFLPVVVNLDITGRVTAPLVSLSLAVDQSSRGPQVNTQPLEAYLNQPDRAAEYATSVLLTNSFLLTTDRRESEVLAGSAFNSVSQLVSSQVNRYLNQVLPNADITLGLLGDESAADLDVTAGLALHLLDERLIIRGTGVFHGVRSDTESDVQAQGLQGEFLVEIRLSPAVSVEVFYRREGEVLDETVLTSTTGAGLSYQTRFSSWRRVLRTLFGTASADEPTADAGSDDGTESRVETP